MNEEGERGEMLRGKRMGMRKGDGREKEEGDRKRGEEETER